jgi:uncharacterized OB-fold protein
VPDEVSAPHWQAAALHVLTIARCSVCSTYSHPPAVVCGGCGSTSPDFTFAPVSGRGRVMSWTVARQPFLPGFETPYVLVDVELEEQPDLRIVARLLGVDESSVDATSVDAGLSIGTAVEVVFEDIADGVAVPAFRIATPSSSGAVRRQ